MNLGGLNKTKSKKICSKCGEHTMFNEDHMMIRGKYYHMGCEPDE